MNTGGTLLTLAPRAVELPLLLRLALDAEQVGATRIHLPADLDRPTQVIAALRQHTRLLISAEPPVSTELLDLVLTDGVLHAGGVAVGLELSPDHGLTAAAAIADLARRLGEATLPVSVACHGTAAVPGLLTALAAGAHVRVGTAGSVAADGQREDISLIARAVGIARLIGRPPLSLGPARALLRLG